MSSKEMAIDLIKQIPEYKMSYVIAFLQGAVIPDEETYTLNADTVEAIEELENGGGTLFKGTTDELFKELMS